MKLRKKRESERIKKHNVMPAALKLNPTAASSRKKISKKRLIHKKQKWNGGLEKLQLLKESFQDLKDMSVKQKPHGQRTYSKITTNQNLLAMDRSEGNLIVKQKNTAVVKRSSTRKKKTSDVQNAVLKKKCRITEASCQGKIIDTIMLLNKNVFKTGRLLENVNAKFKSTNSVKGKKKINASKLKQELPKVSSQSNELVKCLKEMNKISAPKLEKIQKTCLSNKQKNFAKVDSHLAPGRKLRNQQKHENKREPRKSRSTSLIKNRSKTNTLEKSKKCVPTYKTVHQRKIKQNILPANLKRNNLKPMKQKRKKASKNEESKDEDNLPLIYLLQNHTVAWPDSQLSKSERNKTTKRKKISEKKGMQTGQKNVRKRKVTHRDACFALEQTIQDLKAQNSKMLKQINRWQRREKIQNSKIKYKEKALIKYHSISTQTYVQAVTTNTQTAIAFTLQEDTILKAENISTQDNHCSTDADMQIQETTLHVQETSTQTDVQTRPEETVFTLLENTAQKVQDVTQNVCASLNEVTENQGELAVAGSNSEEDIYEDMESEKDFKRKMSSIDLEENSIEYNGSSCANNTENADDRLTQNLHYIGTSQKLEPLWNPQSSGDMSSGLLCSKEEPKIVELHHEEEQCSPAESVSQTTTSFGTRPEIFKVEAQRNDYSLLLQNQPLSNCNQPLSNCNQPLSNFNLHAAHEQDAGIPSFSSCSMVHNGQAALPQSDGWLYRSTAWENGFSATQYVRPQYANCLADVNFAVNIQQAVVKIAENISQHPIQQLSPKVFLIDPLATSTYK